jgi:AAA domain-containing protein
MRQPLTFAYRNLVFGRGADDVWALYRLGTVSYDGLPDAQKRELLYDLASFAYGLEADFQLLRVTRQWSVDEYLRSAALTLDGRHGDREQWKAHLGEHREQLAGREIAEPEVYLSVQLGRAANSPAALLANAFGGGGVDALKASVARFIGLSDPRGLSQRQLDSHVAEEERTFARVSSYLECERAATHELQWLVRRSFCRGVGEPEVEERFLPQALVVEEGGERHYRPLECDLLRLFESPINVGARGLRIESERGESHQALLAVGALPETAAFPGREVEILFAPLEAVDFPVDACFSSRYVPNAQALTLARRKIVDADNTFTEESYGDHGPSSQSSYRPAAARELEDYLTGDGRPPLLRASISLALGARTAEQLEERVEALRREYGSLPLYRPLGEQLHLFVSHLPAQSSRVPGYDDYFLVEQFGAMVPLATHAVGSVGGPYIGHSLAGSRAPVLFDLTEASRTSRPPSVLCAGTLGSGKTMLLQLLLYQALLQGSRVVDVDPKGDHNLQELPEVAERAEVIELSSEERYRGLLDPLRIAPAGTREDLATNFLTDVLPEPMPASWKTEIRRAVRAIAERGEAGNCSAVIEQMKLAGADARDAASALEVYADTGLARLGFGGAGSEASHEASAAKQLTSLRIRRLARPIPGTPKAELSEEERIGQAVLRLVCAYAMRLMGSDRARHKVLAFDEAWFLMQDSVGRRLIEHLNRWARSEFATPILVAHLAADAEEVDNLIGARFVFGMEAESEAAKALALLRLDPEDERLRQRLLQFRRGRCFMRDYGGRVGTIQVDPGPRLVGLLDTTPGQARSVGEGRRVASLA